LTDAAKYAITKSRYVLGYKYSLAIIKGVVDKNKQHVFEITMQNQETVYNDVYNKMAHDDYCTVTFTGDVNFSESEVVDRLLEIFGDDNVEIIPGISSIQIAAAKSKVPLDKTRVITFHVSGDIEAKKMELIDAVVTGKSVILLPRPWPKDPKKRENGVDTSSIKVCVFEHLTQDGKETIFKGKISNLEGKYFDPLSVMVIDQVQRQTYLQFVS
jgi:cobalt-precorrin-7 (C5)-methyltransferase